MAFMRSKDRTSPSSFPLCHLVKFPALKVYQRDNIKKRIQMIHDLKDKKPIEAIQMIRTFYDKFLDTNDRQNLTLHKETLKEMLDELESSAKRFNSIKDFLSFIQHLIKTNQEMQGTRFRCHFLDDHSQIQRSGIPMCLLNWYV
jgi:DNA helicase II / ATP-dependent DNA helicase PcrA